MSNILELKNLFIDIIDFNSITEEQSILLDDFFNLTKSAYILVSWPDSQVYMDKDWFDEEAVLEVEGRFGSSAYFIPIERILQDE